MANAKTSAVPAIMAGIEVLFVSGDVSDLVIKRKGDTHHVHKLVLCTQSKFFMAACTNGSKESTTGVIELPDDGPEIVRAALRFLYGLDYMENTSGIPDLILHTKLYKFADKYNIPTLKTVASKKYNAAAKNGWSTEHFATSIKLIDAFTLPCDKAMRDAVITLSGPCGFDLSECQIC